MASAGASYSARLLDALMGAWDQLWKHFDETSPHTTGKHGRCGSGGVQIMAVLCIDCTMRGVLLTFSEHSADSE